MEKSEKYTNSEKWLEKHLVEMMKARGGIALKYANASQTGYPDRLCLFPGGSICWVELKSKGKKPTKIQSLRHEQLRELGFRVYVCDNRQAVEEAVKQG